MHVLVQLIQNIKQTYNLAVSGVLLAIVGLIGLVGNLLVILVYTHPDQRIHSTSIYLAALASSDFFLILTAMFLFVLEAWRHHNYPLLAWAYVFGAPLVFPIAAVFQTSSVYYCVAAAVDCFIAVVLPESVRQLYCTPKRAKVTCVCIMLLCVIYNIPHFFELEEVACVGNDGLPSTQICPTDIRLDPAYYAIYYTYMYTTFLAIGPLTLLVLLNICVVFTVLTKGTGGALLYNLVTPTRSVSFLLFSFSSYATSQHY
uniref:G_PROTEIN_RECEP_F1_2 domain-containing protein n=1 Tax=Heterorhabditis bacteriophora TaxID=37862 RepID=A0A1I7XT74_HETBA